MNLLFEAFPIFLAMFALVLACRRGLLTRDIHIRNIAIMGAACSVLLIAAQTSWSWSVYAGNRLGEDFANNIWTIFNTLAMLTVIYASAKGSK